MAYMDGKEIMFGAKAVSGGGGTPGEGGTIVVDSHLSATSENPVQNKVITQQINDILDALQDASVDVWGETHNNPSDAIRHQINKLGLSIGDVATDLEDLKNTGGTPGEDGQDGEDGATFTPSVSADGVLSWTNDKGLDNPASVNIKGPAGADGPAGVDGQNGATGNGIQSVAKTGTSGLVDTYTITFTNGSKTTFTVTNGQKGDTGATGPAGQTGQTGATGSTGVGVASVVQTTTSTADGGTNVITVTLTDGTKATFNVKNGSKGSTGAAGSNGTNGKDGTSVTVTNVTTSTADGGNNVVTFSDGKTLTVKNGSKGSTGSKGADGKDGYTPVKGVDYFDGTDGTNGADGKTPVKGVDYWTTADKDEISAYIATELAKRGQLTPEYAESVEWLAENGDKNKMYVLPDGFIYAWMLTEKEIEVGGGYTNLLPLAKATDRTTIYGGDYNGDGVNDGYKTNTKLSGSGGGESASGSGKEAMCSSGFIFPVKAGDILRIKGIAPVTGSNHYVVGYDSSNARTGNDTIASTNNSDGSLYWSNIVGTGKYTIENNSSSNPKGATIVYTIDTAKLGANVNAVRICAAMDENTIVTLNEEIKEGGGTTIITEWDWASTGHAFVPADYEGRIVDLEAQTAENTADIAKLKAGVTDDDLDPLERIKKWDAPIYDANIPIFQLTTEKSAITEAEKTVAAVYAKYDALMARHPNYITKTNLGMCSDGVTPVYRYDFREPEPHRGTTGKKEWSETKAKAIIVSGIHWEWGGIFSLYNALEEVADNPALYHLRRNTHLIVLPVCNPYAVANMSVRNANLVEIHRNFEVDFIYPGESGYIEIGERSHGGTAPLSEVETQYIDNIFKENTDAAFFLTCHSNQSDTVYGTGFTWASPATYYMCNMHYRIVDKLSAAWMEKYGDELAAGIADYRTENTPEWDTRLGSAYLSTTNGTETKQATKYGIQATNIEVTDTFLTHGTKANPEAALSSFTVSRGAEVYANFFLTAFGCYDPKDKALYFK